VLLVLTHYFDLHWHLDQTLNVTVNYQRLVGGLQIVGCSQRDDATRDPPIQPAYGADLHGESSSLALASLPVVVSPAIGIACSEINLTRIELFPSVSQNPEAQKQ
jgi:hypothetical protein